MDSINNGTAFYYSFLIPGIVSFLCSIGVLSTFYIFKKLKRENVCMHFLFMHIADLIQVSSWFIGPKFESQGHGTNYYKCAVQELMFQYGCLCKALWTAAICLLTLSSLNVMQIHSGNMHAKAACCFGLPVILTALSAYFSTYSLFCGDSFKSSDMRHKDFAYLIVFLGAIFVVVAFNVVVIGMVYVKIRNLYKDVSGSSNITFQQADGRRRLLALLFVLTLYPLVFSMAWTPEVLYLFTEEPVAALITGILVNSTGTFFAVIFFTTNRKAKLCWRELISNQSQGFWNSMTNSSFLSRSFFSDGLTSGTDIASAELSDLSSAHLMSVASLSSTICDDRITLTFGRPSGKSPDPGKA